MKKKVKIANNTCKNCKHWALDHKKWCKENNYDFVAYDDNNCSKLLSVLDVEVSCYGDAYTNVDGVCTPKDFSCNLFESE